MTTKTQNREEENHPECRPEEKEVWLRLTASRGDKILFSTFQTEETGAVGVAGELASKIFYHLNFLSISAIKKMS